MLQVRHADPADADACARAHVDAWRAAYRGLVPDAFLDDPKFEAERIEMWRAWTWPQQPGAQVFVPELDGEVVGFGLVGPARDSDHSRCGEVYAFYMHPTVWGSAAATATMARCTDHLHAAGFSEAVLWVLRDNPRARRFYEKTGWSATGDEEMWSGPVAGRSLPEPVAETRYRIDLR
jgi:RimJ/RimL family protein N-acetyltransferase